MINIILLHLMSNVNNLILAISFITELSRNQNESILEKLKASKDIYRCHTFLI